MNVGEAGTLFFLDTNILVYTFDSSAPSKQKIARDLVRHALSSRRGAISTQVVQEFLNVASRKFSSPLSIAQCRRYLAAVLTPLCRHVPSLAFYEYALLIQEEFGYAFYDSLIIAAALELKCTLLLSEDLQTGQRIKQLTIQNPFL